MPEEGIRHANLVSSVGIATGYGLDEQVSGVRFPVGAGNFSLLHRVQAGSGTHPASYSKCIGSSFPDEVQVFGTTVRIQNYIKDGNKSILNSRNAYYAFVKSIFLPFPL
jgi:hypothetical protein